MAILCLAAFERKRLRSTSEPVEPVNPSSPGGDAHFRDCACWGSKKLARIKLLVDNKFGDKNTVDHSNNFIIKYVKDEKMPK
jgi:hypothetical protein